MLEVNGLIAGYRSGPVARLDALSLGAGEAALILGPSGAGKTTLLLAIAGLARRYGGMASIAGVDPFTLHGAARDRFRGTSVGFVFQDLHLIAGLTLLDNILLAPFASGAAQDRSRAMTLLGELGIGDLANRPAERLSRGQAQRAAIARAVLLRPKILLADEPTASLDDHACAAVSTLLVNAARETGAALVIATHDARLKALIARQVTASPIAASPVPATAERAA